MKRFKKHNATPKEYFANYVSLKNGLVIATLFIFSIFTVTQIQLLRKNGTLLGYQVAKKQTTQHTSNSTKSLACETVTEQAVSKVLNLEVDRLGNVFGDRLQPTLISNCLYRSKQIPSRSVTVILRDTKDEASAKSTFSAAKKRTNTEEVAGLGQEAFFSSNVGQLQVRRGKRLLTITVSKPVDNSAVSSKEVATTLAQNGR